MQTEVVIEAMHRAYEVVKDLKALADKLDGLVEEVVTMAIEESGNPVGESRRWNIAGKTTKDESQDDDDTSAEPSQVEKQITLEEVRSVLADKNREGHREKVKAIIEKYGANKLTELDPIHYGAVLEEAGELK